MCKLVARRLRVLRIPLGATKHKRSRQIKRNKLTLSGRERISSLPKAAITKCVQVCDPETRAFKVIASYRSGAVVLSRLSGVTVP